MIIEIRHKKELLALIVPNDFDEPGIHFFTPPAFSQQLAFMRHPAGKEILPHVHNPVPRQVQYTLEVLLLKKGRLRIDFYDSFRNYIESRVVGAGDVVLLATGGHGFEVLEEIEMIEVKQGPFAGDSDKTRFHGIQKSQVTLKL